MIISPQGLITIGVIQLAGEEEWCHLHLVVTISHDIAVDASTNTLGAVTVDASKTTVAAGQTITAGGASDINGTLAVSGTGIYDANGTFDATGSNVTYSGSGRLQLGGTVTSLGTFAPGM